MPIPKLIFMFSPRQVRVGAAVLIGFPLSGLSAGFECNRAQTVIEKSICGNQELSRLDDQLNALYYVGSQIPGLSTNTKRSQFQWLIQRDKCNDAPCLVKSYSDRILSLQESIGRVAEPIPAQGEWIKDFGIGNSPYCQLSGGSSSFSISLTTGVQGPEGHIMCVADCGRKIEDGAILGASIRSNVADVEYETGFNELTRSRAYIVVVAGKLYWAALGHLPYSYCSIREVLSPSGQR